MGRRQMISNLSLSEINDTRVCSFWPWTNNNIIEYSLSHIRTLKRVTKRDLTIVKQLIFVISMPNNLRAIFTRTRHNFCKRKLTKTSHMLLHSRNCGVHICFATFPNPRLSDKLKPRQPDVIVSVMRSFFHRPHPIIWVSKHRYNNNWFGRSSV